MHLHVQYVQTAQLKAHNFIFSTTFFFYSTVMWNTFNDCYMYMYVHIHTYKEYLSYMHKYTCTCTCPCPGFTPSFFSSCPLDFLCMYTHVHVHVYTCMYKHVHVHVGVAAQSIVAHSHTERGHQAQSVQPAASGSHGAGREACQHRPDNRQPEPAASAAELLHKGECSLPLATCTCRLWKQLFSPPFLLYLDSISIFLYDRTTVHKRGGRTHTQIHTHYNNYMHIYTAALTALYTYA